MINGKVKKVAVYCASKNGLDPAFGKAAEELGRQLACREIELVYGGSCVGLMKRVADSVLRNGGEVTGVYPRGHFLEELQTNLTRTYIVSSMAERKALMLELSDAWLALPGGFGTLDEFFDALCLLQIRNHSKPCGLLNVNGYYDDLLRFLRNACRRGLLRDTDLKLINVHSSPAELLDALCEELEGREPFFSRIRTADAFTPESAHGKNAWQQKRIPETCL